MVERLRICFVGLDNYPVLNPEYSHHYFGGESVQQSLIAKKFASRGYEVSMLVKDHGQSKDHLYKGIRCLSTYSEGDGLPVLRFIYPKMYSIWSALNKANADVYYQSCADMLTGVVAAFCMLHNKKFIYRVASDLDVEPDQLKMRFFRDRFMYLWGLKNADIILPQTTLQNDMLKKNLKICGHITKMIVETVEGTVGEKVDVLWVNNIRPLKRADRIYNIAKSLPQLKFVIIGGPVPGYEKYYTEVIDMLDTLDNVVIKGKLPFTETAKYYNSCRVFFNTSDIEGFPNSFLQVWAAGKPIVSIFDPDDLIAKLGLGVVVKDDKDYFPAIEGLITDKASYERASTNAFRYISENHSDKVVIDSIASVIERL